MNTDKKRGEKDKISFYKKLLGILFFASLIPSACYGCEDNTPSATICYYHWIHSPLSKSFFYIYEDSIVASLVADKYEFEETIVNVDSIYGKIKVSDCIEDSINLLLKKTYLLDHVDDYLVNEPSEWATISDSNYLEIEFRNGSIYEYSLGDINKSGTQYVGARIIQYSYSFRKLAKLIENLHYLMLTMYMFR